MRPRDVDRPEAEAARLVQKGDLTVRGRHLKLTASVRRELLRVFQGKKLSPVLVLLARLALGSKAGAEAELVAGAARFPLCALQWEPSPQEQQQPVPLLRLPVELPQEHHSLAFHRPEQMDARRSYGIARTDAWPH